MDRRQFIAGCSVACAAVGATEIPGLIAGSHVEAAAATKGVRDSYATLVGKRFRVYRDAKFSDNVTLARVIDGPTRDKALEQFTLVLANELGPRGITVNALLVGPTKTDMLDGLLARVPAFEAMVVQRTPMGRLGTPAEIADVAAFLASEDARWVTGQCLRVDGGAR